MRTRKQILKDYLILINEEKGLKYSEKDIDAKIDDTQEAKIIEKILLDELYSTELYNGQTISSLRAFYIWADIVIRYDYKTGENVWNSFVKKQFILVERHKLCCYMAQRGAGKSFFIAMYILFKMFLIPYFDVGYCSNVPKQKRRFLKSVRTIVDTNDILLEKKDAKGISNRKTQWGAEEMEYNNGMVEGTTVGTTPRGGHHNLAIGDDPLREDRKYPTEYIVNYFQGVYKQTILRKKGRYLIVGTPSDSEDLFHTLMNEKLDKNNRPIGKMVIDGMSAAGYYCSVFPGILNDATKEVLVPEIWGYDELMMEKQRIGEIRFNREILCKCTSYKNSLVSSSLFKSCCDETLSMMQKGELGKKYVIFVDSATSDAPTADYCAMTVWENGPKFILRHLFHEKGYPLTDPDGGVNDQPHKLMQLYRDFNNATVIVEKNNAGIALIQAVKAKGLDVIEHFTGSYAGNNQSKVNDIIEYFEQGLKSGIVVFPANYEDNYTIDALEKVKTEHLNFGVKKTTHGEKYEALAGHDDIFTSCYGAFKYREASTNTLSFAITVSGN